jgi:hypothetical protein
VNAVSLARDPRGKRYISTCFALKEVGIPDRHLWHHINSENLDPLPPVDLLVPAIPAHAAEAIQRAMSLDSNARFPTTEQFAQALIVCALRYLILRAVCLSWHTWHIVLHALAVCLST